MVVELAYTCENLPAHSHVFRHEIVVNPDGSRRGRPVDTGEVRIWVDWKAVAREPAPPGASVPSDVIRVVPGLFTTPPPVGLPLLVAVTVLAGLSLLVYAIARGLR